MKLKAIKNYTDKTLKRDIESGLIVNEIYEKNKIELTEEREKELIAAGVVAIVEEAVVIPEAAIVNPEELKDDEVIEVEAAHVDFANGESVHVEEIIEVKKNVVEEEKQK